MLLFLCIYMWEECKTQFTDGLMNVHDTDMHKHRNSSIFISLAMHIYWIDRCAFIFVYIHVGRMQDTADRRPNECSRYGHANTETETVRKLKSKLSSNFVRCY